ncbi:MAG: pilus assembly PilX N-terminal domain-containing protein [Syntrophaceae bacterium]|nr:pilus assembly PilX N-terminal domain-containing protein [Syntrophaceae bacterium]
MMNKSIGIFKNESGVALVIALIMMIVMTVIVLAASFTSIFEIKLAGNKRGSTDAFYAADSGVQVALARIENFNLPGQYVDNKYNPFTNPQNPNPTNAEVTITFDPIQQGAPRGTGISATSFEFNHYMIESKGKDQTELSPIKSQCTVQEKIVRLIPTMQGGY